MYYVNEFDLRGDTYLTNVRKMFGFFYPLVAYRIHATSSLLSAFWGPPPPHPLQTSFKYVPLVAVLMTNDQPFKFF